MFFIIRLNIYEKFIDTKEYAAFNKDLKKIIEKCTLSSFFAQFLLTSYSELNGVLVELPIPIFTGNIFLVQIRPLVRCQTCHLILFVFSAWATEGLVAGRGGVLPCKPSLDLDHKYLKYYLARTKLLRLLTLVGFCAGKPDICWRLQEPFYVKF